jgi:hypothetical protein
MGFLSSIFKSASRPSSPVLPLKRECEDPQMASFHAKTLKEEQAKPTPVSESENFRRHASELVKEAAWEAKIWLPDVKYDPDLADAQFETQVARLIPLEDRSKSFFIKIAGASHRNEDGTSRTRIIKECEIFESLTLNHQLDNKFDPNAIAVLRQTGSQIGFLDARLASEIVNQNKRYGPCWAALFRRPTYHPETGKIVGALLYMIRFSDDYIQRKSLQLIKTE